MDVLLRRGRAACVALLMAGALAPDAAPAQSPLKGGAIDVPTLVTVPPPAEASSANSPRSSYDYETARTSPAKPWEAPRGPWDKSSDTIAAATAAPPPGFTAFTGEAPPLSCREAGYRMIIDERSDMRSGTLCTLPDGTWLFLP